MNDTTLSESTEQNKKTQKQETITNPREQNERDAPI